MIEIPQQKPTSELKVLIIDSQPLVHTVIKGALLDIGIKDVQSAHDAYIALKLCEDSQFDMVLIAFDVQSDKDGFNLFEEMKFKNYITKTTCVIFLSADTSAGLVNCVVEMEPTDFWVKPLDKSRVCKRLQQVMLIEKKLYALKYCFDHNEYPTTIYYAERQLLDSTLSHYHPHINRLIGRSLYKLAEYQDAYNFYYKLAEVYDYAWVQVGLAATLLKLDRVQEALRLTKVLLARDDTRFATYDLLADYHIDKEEFQQGYDIIQQATLLAPRSIERNKKSWNLARLNHDRKGQFLATKNMAKYAKNSIHDSPALTMNIVRASIDLATTLSESESAKVLLSTEKTLARLHHEYSTAAELKEQLGVIQARILNLRNNKKDAESIMRNRVKVKIEASFEDTLDKIKAFHEVGLWESSMDLLNQLKSNFKHDSFTGKVLAEYLEQETKARQDVRYTPKELGEMASIHYKNRRYKPSYNLLSQAAQLAPNNTNIALSLLKVLVKLTEDIMLNEDEDKQIKECILLLESEKLTSTQQQNLSEYKSILEEAGILLV
ncbi:response regulator [Paraglaciecola aquimarina]|uniref:Response regulator n=1 Tax=Paraglaciecola aquimarina TaxID=1235557 RepID=A0ABU3T1D5_9ALTE|nr:response regulator [Paraglaciecola aquimarina]MDU0356073.1 response regulator [Paraglaciecola aquimarina]